MANIEINASSSVCRRCGKSYGRLKGNFPVSYSPIYKGVGYMPYCRTCIEEMYASYLAVCKEPALAVRQMCRKLDLYWNQSIFDAVNKQSAVRSLMTSYIYKLNGLKHAGLCYDDTLIEEGAMWSWPDGSENSDADSTSKESSNTGLGEEDLNVPKDVIEFWGPGYTPAMYEELEQRKSYWMSKFPDDYEIDIGTEALIRQICNLEIDINRDRAAGKPIDKNVTTLNTLLGSAQLKPTQKKDNADGALENTPFGVWIKRWEDERPVPEADPDFKDPDGIINYIDTWFRGHLAKMLGLKNSYSKLYEDKIKQMRIERPEYEDDDDETFLYDALRDGEPDDQD